MHAGYLFLISLLISFFSTLLISRVALKNGVVDYPGAHKLHQEPKPILGGLGIYLAAVISLLIFYPLTPQLAMLIIAASLLVAIGILDDLYNLKPLYKLAGQVASAAIVVLGSTGRYSVFLDYFNQYYIPGFVTLILIIGWIVLMINAFNLIDGLDGLAAGTAALILGWMMIISVSRGSLGMLGFQLLALGACIGFLPFNFQPAKIFMGDTGSMLLGFLLSVLYLNSNVEPFSISLVLGSAFIFAYPALDVAFSIYRRLRRRGSIFKADKDHIHHLLLRLGFSMRQTVMILYSVSIFFGAASGLILCFPLSPYVTTGIGAATVVGIFFLFRYLNRLGNMPKVDYRPSQTALGRILEDRTVANGK